MKKVSKIKVMDQILANKIAAGEVVEKVASVVKELVENALDAGSDQIKIELKEAGTKEIIVIDNGEGMDEEDAKTAFFRHATSKIINEEDLYHIQTLGFRGEALASIASVSQVELITSTGEIGTKILINGGKIEAVEKADARKGTIIKIKNLFYNTPARLKYLKSLYTELANVTSLLNRFAFSHPNVKFLFKNDGKTILQTDGSNDLHKVIMNIYGIEVAKEMLLISSENADYQISGFVSKPQINRSNRNHIITIVNRRVVRNAELNKIINDAYYTYKPDNLYPIVILKIKVDPVLIDVNIHPTKQDIKFSKLEELKELVKTAIEEKLGGKQFIPKIKSDHTEQAQFDFLVKEPKKEIFLEKSLTDDDLQKTKTLPDIEPVAALFGTYIIAQNEDGMYLIDQHAANERINYEKIREELLLKTINKTNLLIPFTLEFTNDEFIILKENFSLINELGFKVEEFGINSLIIKSHPIWLPKKYEEKAIKHIFEIIIEKENFFDLKKFNEKVAINLSCKLSIKANEYISIQEMEKLIKDLRNCKNPYTCPHGRPTIIFYEKYELEKMFKRSGF